jgi:cytochrome c556
MRMLLVSAALVAGVGAVVAQSDPIKQRNQLMSSLQREVLRPVTRIARGESPFNREVVEKSFDEAFEIARKLPPLWPPDSAPKNPTERYYSSPKIWENKADFDARMAKLPGVIAENRAKAVSGLDGLKAANQAIDDACDSCHERYRVRNR